MSNLNIFLRYVLRDHDIVRTSQRRTSQRSISKLYRYTSTFSSPTDLDPPLPTAKTLTSAVTTQSIAAVPPTGPTEVADLFDPLFRRTGNTADTVSSSIPAAHRDPVIAQGGQPTIDPIDPAFSASSARRPHPAITGLIADVRSRETSIARGSTAAVEQQLFGEPIRLNSTVRGGSPDSIASIIVVTEPSG
ncbi:hypothetical protein PTTG_29060 [Puccinia triticina 1-1 BBBD Race 1]|uniref:Uncharacterized protein n=1 Tax=Puccinia triticina (isolate 1-1 / race 1 (BBBD)) TaxID=630390 RepID=A0A180G8V2_PUCT1|nr:hypothetical protein PTTG_29060 [Puccinia triticina 1-1 BBBD Race 1]